jgi:uncharacterized membrane protein
MGGLPWVLAGLVTAGIIHILCVFGVPWLAAQDAWTRLSASARPNALFIADRESGKELPFTPSDVIAAYCVYDLSNNNLVVSSPLLEPSWSLALSTRSGENFYVVTGADAKQPEAQLLIVRQDRLSEEASTGKTEEGQDQNIVVSPDNTGIVAIRAPLRGESFRARTVEELRRAKCEAQMSFEPVTAAVSEPPAAEAPVPKVERTRRPYPPRRRP